MEFFMRTKSFGFFLFLFILSMIAWFSLLGLWIYYFITNYLIFEKVGEKLSPQLVENPSNVFPLVTGLILLLVIFAAMIAFFSSLYRQKSLAETYDNFIANVTHELKSPLSSVQLYIETLLKRELSKEQQTDFLTQILSDIKRLNNYINSILYLSGFQNRKLVNRYPSDYQIYQADQFFKNVIMQSATEMNIQNHVIIKGKAPYPCVLDKQWMKIVVDNLLDNAKKYSSKNFTLEVTISSTSRHVVIHFTDNGIGIPKEYQKKVFEKFYRLQLPESPSVKGTGLGLYWVKEIVKYHGGKIEVNSNGINKGTTFSIQLPIYQMRKKRYLNNLIRRNKVHKFSENSINE